VSHELLQRAFQALDEQNKGLKNIPTIFFNLLKYRIHDSVVGKALTTANQPNQDRVTGNYLTISSHLCHLSCTLTLWTGLKVYLNYSAFWIADYSRLKVPEVYFAKIHLGFRVDSYCK
jgi:hypothetical protein